MSSARDTFQKLVEECNRNNLDRTIFNASKDHALILFQELFRASIYHEEDVKIISGNLDDDFYNGLSGSLEACIEAGRKVEVVVLNNPDLSNNKFAKILQGDNTSVLDKAPGGTKIASPHFILVGDKRYRAETDHKQAKAIANFNNSSVGGTLTEIFALVENQLSHN